MKKQMYVMPVFFLLLIFSIAINCCKKEEENEVPTNKKYVLTITATNGEVIVCVNTDTLPNSAQYTIEDGKTAVLTAIASDDYQFDGWTGASSASDNPVSIVMTEDKTVVANFGEDQDPPYEAGDKKTFTFDEGRSEITMIYCPGGTFLSNEDDSDTDYEDGPEVSCGPFWISETEVTNDLLAHVYSRANAIDYYSGVIFGGIPGVFNTLDKKAHNYLSEYVARWGYQNLIYKGYDLSAYIFFKVEAGREDQPCKEISWYGAIMMCNWLTNEVLGLTTEYDHRVYSGMDKIYSHSTDIWIHTETIQDLNKKGFRLPSSIEWECAARWQGSDNSNNAIEWPEGSKNYWTPGGYASGATAPTNDVAATSAVAVYKYYDAIKPNPTATDNVKGDRLPNALGLYDMSGNVMEFCFDTTEDGYGTIARGGGAFWEHSYLKIAVPWEDMVAGGTGSDLGFRVVMNADN